MIRVATRTEYCARLKVSNGMVGIWVSKGWLGGEALRGDGTIDVDKADAQLLACPDVSARVKERISSLGQSGEAVEGETPAPVRMGRKPLGAPLMAPAAPERHILQLNKARAMSALVSAERARRQLEEERGRYVKAEDVERAWSRGLTEIINQIEFALPALDRELAVDRKGIGAIRDWWRGLRQTISAGVTAALPANEYVEDERAM